MLRTRIHRSVFGALAAAVLVVLGVSAQSGPAPQTERFAAATGQGDSEWD